MYLCASKVFSITETLAILARVVGKETFLPLTSECMQLGLKLLESNSDPDLRRCV